MRLADRKLLIDRMDKQFQKDLEMRKKNNIVNKQALGTVATLNLLQKDMRQFTSYVFDLRTQATSNTRAIEAILNRPDIKKLSCD